MDSSLGEVFEGSAVASRSAPGRAVDFDLEDRRDGAQVLQKTLD